MALPEDYWTLPVEKIVDLAVEAIESDGIFWFPLTRTPSLNLESAVSRRMPDQSLYLCSPPPDWDHVLIDTGRLPDWTEWVNNHATARFALKERGIPDHKLPPLPWSIRQTS
ncbi:MAG: hypothetical protein PW843_27870 [Azospirillaceae bacterium]|nr:hypothetical protein [Azospirillaceae bacterium]